MVTQGPVEKHVTVNGVSLRYLDWGRAGKLPLICLHGHTGQARLWDEFAKVASSKYQVLAVDQRGHGRSDWAKSGYDRDRFVEDLGAFVDTLELSEFVLVGLSMGGWNSLLYTVNNPKRVERIILVDIAPDTSPEFIRYYDEEREPTPAEFPSVDAAALWMRRNNPWASDESLRKDAEGKLRQREDGNWTWLADPALFDVPLADMTDPGLIGRYWKAIETIPCPILHVRGSESTLVSDETVRRMETSGQEFTNVDIPGAGHVVAVDKPEEFVNATRPFLGL